MKGSKGELTFVRLQRSWAGFWTEALALCCKMTVSFKLLVGSQSDLADKERAVRKTGGKAHGREKILTPEKRAEKGDREDLAVRRQR